MEKKKGKEYIINKNSAERGGIQKKNCDENTFNFLISDSGTGSQRIFPALFKMRD